MGADISAVARTSVGLVERGAARSTSAASPPPLPSTRSAQRLRGLLRSRAIWRPPPASLWRRLRQAPPTLCKTAVHGQLRPGDISSRRRTRGISLQA